MDTEAACSHARPRQLDDIEPCGLDHAETAKLIGISESHLHNLEATGRMGPEPFRLGRAKRYIRQEVSDWINAKCPPRHRWQVIRRVGR